MTPCDISNHTMCCETCDCECHEPTRIPMTRVSDGAWILPAASIRRYGADFFRELAGGNTKILAAEDLLEGDTEA